MDAEDKYLNEVLANGMVSGMLSQVLRDSPRALLKFETVMDEDGQVTNAHYVWFGALESRYRLTIELDPE